MQAKTLNFRAGSSYNLLRNNVLRSYLPFCEANDQMYVRLSVFSTARWIRSMISP